MFALIFKVVPDTGVAWHDAWIGAIATGLMFTIGKFLIGFYLDRSGIASTYGAAASIVKLLLWIYYSSQIVLFGAEITKAYSDARAMWSAAGGHGQTLVTAGPIRTDA